MTVKNTPRPRTLFFDVDGTLVDHGLPLSPAVRDSIRQARKNGHLAFICTGRSEDDVQDYIRDIGFDGEITNGGAFAKVGDESVLAMLLPEALSRRLVDYLTDLGVGVMVQTDGATYADRRSVELTIRHDEAVRASRKNVNPQDAEDPAEEVLSFAEWASTFPPLEEVDFGKIVKVIFVSDKVEDLDQMQADLGDAYHVIPGSMPLTGGSSAEICAAGITKGFAIEQVLDHMGLDIEDAVGVGDSWNDFEMFQVCGQSVVMGNADPELKKHAQMETASVHDDGVKVALETLGLI